MITVFLFICTIITSVISQLPHTGECPLRTPLRTLDVRKLTGTWYENQRTPSLLEWPFKCTTFKVQPFFEHKTTVKILSLHRISGQSSSVSIPLKALDPEGRNGKLVANLTSLMQSGIVTRKSLSVQLLALENATNPNWAVLWGCRNYPKAQLHTESVWVLTKAREIDDADRDDEEVHEALVSLNLEHLLMRDTVQTECGQQDNLDKPDVKSSKDNGGNKGNKGGGGGKNKNDNKKEKKDAIKKEEEIETTSNNVNDESFNQIVI